MSISRFKFVSPGVFVKEIDKSKTPIPATITGPTVIGRAVKGPMMRPVRVDSYADFVEVFGEPHPGGYNGDVWRAGVTLAPTYGAYAAKAYLAFNGPLTFVRLGGYQNDSVTSNSTGKVLAGWSTVSAADINTGVTSSVLSKNGGAYGLFVAPIVSSSANTYAMPATTGTLAAVFYVTKGSVGLIGNPLSGVTPITDSAGATWIRSNTHGTPSFTMMVKETTSPATSSITFNFDGGSKEFIRSKFNTNPTSVNSDTVSTQSVVDYFLGESFETAVNNLSIAQTNGSYAAVVVALQDQASTTKTYGYNFNKNAEASKTGWVVGQHKGTSGSFVASTVDGSYPVQNLFRLVSLSEGSWNQNNIKISISDIKPSPSRYEKYGTFTLTIRSMRDDDQNSTPLEVYTGLSLNPVSPNYIAKKIGDMYMTWDYDRKLFNEFGTYANVSKYVRVEMDPLVDAGGTDQDLLPFGFYGIKKYKPTLVSGGLNDVKTITSPVFVDTKIINSFDATKYALSGNAQFTASLDYPSLPFVVSSSTDSTATSLDKVYFGLKTKLGTTKLFDEQTVDLLRTKPAGILENSTLLTYSSLFSLDDVMLSASTNPTELTTSLSTRPAFWAIGNRAVGYSMTSKTDFEVSGGYGGVNFQRVARFTMPLVGGFNGLDITEKEPFSERSSNSPLASTDDETTSYAYNSIKVAMDSVSDPEVVETNLITIPGIQNAKLTNKLIEICEQRADALAVIDIEGDFKSVWESTAEVKPNVYTAISSLKARTLNSSYGCTFFPAVLTKDTSANALVSLPSSVVALGTIGSSAAFSEIWFAPAGFNRGGLSNGAAGFPVVGVKTKLTSQERDRLYEVNINPIASFPAEGIVVFGQKTLQATPSSLDRINVRRLMIYLKKEISKMANTILFDPNSQITWARFTGRAVPFLQSVQSRFGLTDFKVVLDETTTTPELVDRNIVYAKIFLKPARTIEYIALDFILTNTGASFDD